MIASFRPSLTSLLNEGTIISEVVTAVSISHATVWLGQAGEVGHLPGRLLGEQGEQALGVEAAGSGHATDGGGSRPS